MGQKTVTNRTIHNVVSFKKWLYTVGSDMQNENASKREHYYGFLSKILSNKWVI